MHRIAVLSLSLFAIVLLAVPAWAERRVALVIGNGAYREGPLKNPTNDARDMAAALRALGFEVLLCENASRRVMNETIDTFWQSIKKGGTGLFFFAGHGLQVAGENYLVPVDAQIRVERDVQEECISASRVLGRMENAGNAMNIVILDACRNNPFARAFRSAERGLAKMDAPTGSLVAFATAPGDVAADGVGKNGLYTSHLLKHLSTPGLKVEDVLKLTRIGVAADSARLGKKQTPWESSSLMGDFYFVGESSNAVTNQKQPPTPGTVQGSLLADLESKAQAESESKAQWAAWQKGMKMAVDKARALESSLDLSVADKLIGWQRVATTFAKKNPYGDEDVQLRAVIQSRVAYWQAELAKGAPIAATAITQAPKTIRTWREPMTGMEFAWISKGCTLMGSDKTENKREAAEGPRHEVCLEGYWLGRTTVTQEQWHKIMGANPSANNRGGAYPVESISWDEAKVFIAKLNAATGERFRLPTEAEWEYACRAGAETAFPFGNTIGPSQANYDSTYSYNGGATGQSRKATAPVGSFPQNEHGLFDMHGNVWQWCEDTFSDSFYGRAPKQNPVNTTPGLYRVLRGGAWNSDPSLLRCAKREWASPAQKRNSIGIRLVRID